MNATETSAYIRAETVPALLAWVEQRRQAGELTPEIEGQVQRVVMGLNASRRKRHRIILEGLQADVAKLAAMCAR